jgi:hypothetical protein
MSTLGFSNLKGIYAGGRNGSAVRKKGRKSRGRKSRGRKSRGRKSRSRMSGGRKSRRRKSRRRMSGGRKSRRRKSRRRMSGGFGKALITAKEAVNKAADNMLSINPVAATKPLAGLPGAFPKPAKMMSLKFESSFGKAPGKPVKKATPVAGLSFGKLLPTTPLALPVAGKQTVQPDRPVP